MELRAESSLFKRVVVTVCFSEYKVLGSVIRGQVPPPALRHQASELVRPFKAQPAFA